MLVVAASALFEVLLETEIGARIGARLFAAGETLHAPDLSDLECAQVFRRHVQAAAISATRAAEALDDLANLPLTRYPHDILLPRIWELRHALSAYDAAYLASAEILDAPLVTRARALAASHVRVELF